MTDSKQLKIATIIPAPTKDGSGCHLTQGTRVLLSDGSELSGVISINLSAEANGVWTALIEVHPQVIPTITAVADIREVDITALQDESRVYAAVAAD
ncbi:MAG TPA: hypothetical protein VGC62_27485 [Pseudomonas sp.]|uniref:hypothetical protein n=1 Tax=Pseudomonas sp. TaxID=306 RepID=UPI002EDAD5F9